MSVHVTMPKGVTIEVTPAKTTLEFKSPAEAFAFAERICARAYAEQGAPARTPEERGEQRLAREQRDASYFERLYCQVRDMANDWHRESEARYLGIESGKYDHDYLTPDKAVATTFRHVFERIADWDY